MTRREIREEVFKLLFQAAFFDTEVFLEQLSDVLLEVPLPEEDELPVISDDEWKKIHTKAKTAFEHFSELDEAIDSVSTEWRTSRMNKVDLTLIRLAVYEIRFEKLPEGVAINEAVEIAKNYGTDHSGSFVNGVLGRLSHRK